MGSPFHIILVGRNVLQSHNFLFGTTDMQYLKLSLLFVSRPASRLINEPYMYYCVMMIIHIAQSSNVLVMVMTSSQNMLCHLPLSFMYMILGKCLSGWSSHSRGGHFCSENQNQLLQIVH